MALPSPSPSEIAQDVPEPSSSPSTAAAGGSTKKRQRSASMTSGASAERRAPSAAPSDARPPSSSETGPSSAFPSAPPTPPGGFRATVSDSEDDSDRGGASYFLQDVDQELEVGQPQWRNFTPEVKAAFVRPTSDGEQLQLGAGWYIVSAKWWRRFRRAVGDPDDVGAKEDANEGPIDEADLGPVDNSDIVTEDGDLIPGIVEGEDAVFLPSAVCEALYLWQAHAYILSALAADRSTFSPPQVWPAQGRSLHLPHSSRHR
jgi:ubiquitin carboxyl-terminal hydrolase 4/11/15